MTSDADCRALLAAALAADDQCAYGEAGKLGQSAALAADRERDGVTLASALRVVGRSLIDRGKLHSSLRPLRRALAVAQSLPSGNELIAARIEHDLFCAEMLAGRVRAAGVHLAAAAKAYPAEHVQRVKLEIDSAWFAVEAGDGRDAAQKLRAYIEHPSRRVSVFALSHLAVAEASQGISAGLAALRERIEEGDGGCAAWPWFAAGWASALAGRVRDAQQCASTARRMAAASGDEYTRARAARLLVEL